MTPEAKLALERARTACEKALTGLHLEHFMVYSKLTLLVRNPEEEDGDILITADSPKLITAAIERLTQVERKFEAATEPPLVGCSHCGGLNGTHTERDCPGRADPNPAIDRFVGDYRWLSNFWPTRIEYEGHVYKSSEHAFQAAKAAKGEDREIVAGSKTPGEAKRRGRQVKLRKDWEEVKVDVMRTILKWKFAPSSELAKKLLATSPARLVEGNHWGDTFWGVDDRRGGENHLGQLLMEIRDELLSSMRRKTS